MIKTFKDLQEQSYAWIQHNFPNNNGDDPLFGIMEELGEVTHSHLKRKQNIRTNENHEELIKDGIGDLVIYLCDYCNQNGLDLEECINIAANTAFSRDWIKYPVNGINI
jgi:NTP pyrophosphatase (non-canonical NTP hydrolase)